MKKKTIEVHDIPVDKLSDWAKALGRRGGLATKEMYGTAHYKEMRARSRGRAKTGTKLPIDKR